MTTLGRRHSMEYGAEALGLGLFMVSACLFAQGLFGEGSPLLEWPPLLRRVLMGLAMGGTAVGLIYSPWGRRSGAHMNPAVTLAFWRLGKIKSGDALFYAAFQTFGGILGTFLAGGLLPAVAQPPVRFALTQPGGSVAVAFVAETAMTGGLLTLVLGFMGHPRLQDRTGWAAGTLLAVYIAFLSPLSGVSINPARSLASALAARDFSHLWVYMAAPPLGALLAVEFHRRTGALAKSLCAKLIHDPDRRCIFCGYLPGLRARTPPKEAVS